MNKYLFFISILGDTPADDKLWFTGSYTQRKTYLMSPDGTLTFGVETPTGYDAACVVQQHDGKLLILGKNKITYLVFLFNTVLAISGGYFTAQSVYRHDPVTKTFEKLQDLQSKKSHSGCALFYSRKHNNRPVAYIGHGGASWVGGNAVSAELLDYTQTDQWETRNYLLLYNLAANEVEIL